MSSLQSLLHRRHRLGVAIKQIEEARAQMRDIRNEAATDSAIAVTWAAIMLVTDIVKTGLSATNKTAAAGFAAIDKSIDTANEVIEKAGGVPMANKADLLRQVDPSLRTAADIAASVRTARDFLNKAGLPRQGSGAQPIDLIVELGVDMADNTLLMLDAGLTDQNNARQYRGASRQAEGHAARLARKMREVDQQIARMLELARTA